MKIAIDVRCLMDGRRTGVEEYTTNLLLSLFETDQENDYVLFFNSWKKPGFDFSLFNKFPNVKIKNLKIPNKLLNFLFWYFDWPHIDKICGGADVVFLPNIIFYGVSSRTKLILTVHDLSFEQYPQTFSLKRRLWHVFINPKKICRQANKIIAVSHSTRNDIIWLYKIDPQKIHVVHSAVSEKFRPINRNEPRLLSVKEKYKLPFRFILYLGTIEPRKNIIGIVRAFTALQDEARKNNNQEIQKYFLVIAGSKGWLNEKITAAIKESVYEKYIILTRFVEEDDKEYFINLASLFVYPSFFEGFGFPPLEAMRCGVPVIASNNSSFPEIIGSAGILVDPDKPDEISRALREIMASRELREIVIKRGLEIAQEFDWKKTAREFLKLLIK